MPRLTAIARIGLVLLSAASLAAPAAAQERDPIARARLLYNDRDFAAAILAADEAGSVPERADRADLIAARAFLEQFRQTADADDLINARERLRRLNPDRLDAIERTEFVVGLGETLYFEEAGGAAADVFDSLLAGAVSLAPDARERVLDWWASALDRVAQPRPDIERQAVYQKILDRMREELGVNDGSATALYWLSAAALRQGDVQAAWDAAEAGWLRAPLSAEHGAALRGDLDRLVVRGIVPARSRILAQPPETFSAEWDHFKEKWEKPQTPPQ